MVLSMAQQHGVASCSTAYREFVMEEVEPEATPVFKSRHTVFLSHSGEQKAFVERLCVALEGCFLYPFFDKCDHSLPIGDNVADKISDAIKECHVGVVILSKKFFTSKWPMRELVAMVDEVAKRKGSFKIIPVYYSISTQEVDDGENRRQWLLEWEKLAVEKPGEVEVARWQAALDSICGINGLKFDGVSELRLEKVIVDLICELVPPEIRLDDTHIQGRDRLCKEIQDNIDAWRKVKMNGVCVGGLYGVGGIGKTSISKVLCNKFFREFQGRVCHAELGKKSEEELMREVVKKLTGTSYDRLHGFKEDKMRNMLNDGIIKEAVFLVLDNMSDTYISINEAKGYLSARLPSGSIVMVTSRSLGSLIRLRPYVDESNCMEMPELKVQEAKSLFAKSANFEPRNEDDEQFLSYCVNKCYFRKDDGNLENCHFHPLALDVLGRQLGCINPKEWRAQLDNIDKIGEDIFNQSRENNHPIFSILRKSFDALSPDDQMLFMDIGLFMPDYVSVDSVYSSLERTFTLLSKDRSSISSADGVWRWLRMMHRNQGVEDVMSWLEMLKSKSLLESLGDGIMTRIGMHDLWRAFCVAETKSGELRCRRWVYETQKRSELVETSPSGTCWENVKRMTLRRGLEGVNFAHFPNVTALKLSELCLTQKLVVDLSRLCHLKSLEVSGRHLHRLVLQGLSHYLLFISLVPDVVELVSPPWSLGEHWASWFNSQQLMRQIECLNQLQFLWLDGHGGDKLLDMRTMASMRWAIFSSCKNVVGLTGLSSRLTNLRVLDLRGCTKLRSCVGVGDLVNLEELNCQGCERLESLPNLGKLRSLRKLEVSGCPLIMEVPGLGNLVALEELHAGQIIISRPLYDASAALYRFEFPDLHKLRSLRVLRLLRCQFRSCPGVGDLVNLEEFNCSQCESLLVLPNLENLTKLRKLDMSGCPLINEVPGLGELVALEELLAGTDFYDSYYYSYSLKLPDMRKLRSLRVLRLPRCRLEAVPGFESLISLQEMEADFREMVHRPTALRQPMKLQRLTICGWSLDGLDGLHNLAMLRTLDIRCCAVDELPDFRSLVSLKELTMVNCNIKDVCGLSNLRALETLMIQNCEVKGMPGLLNLYTLESLVIKACNELETVPDLQGLTKLRCVVVVDCPMLRGWDGALDRCSSDVGFDPSPHYESLTDLRTLNLSECENLTHVTCIGAFSQLESLTCLSLPVEELPDLSNFPRLKYLCLSGCSSLRTLTSTKRSTALQLLDLDDCSNLTELPDLGMFPTLEKLLLKGCSALSTLSSSELLPALKVLDASGCKRLSRDEIDRLQASCPQCRIHAGLVEWSELSQHFMGWFGEYETRPHSRRKQEKPGEELRSHFRSAYRAESSAPGDGRFSLFAEKGNFF